MYLFCSPRQGGHGWTRSQSPARRAGSGFRHGSPARAPECKSAVVDPNRLLGVDEDAQARLARARCGIVQDVVTDMLALAGERQQLRRDRRRTLIHIRQIAMYICHVVLQLSLTDVGMAFGRDRTTVSYSCHVVEDRRDDRDYDQFIAVIERIMAAAFTSAAGEADA